MPILDFLVIYFVPNISLYIVDLFFVFIFFTYVYNKLMLNKYEIFIYFFPVLGTIFSTGLVIFLFQISLITFKLFILYITSTFILFGVLFIGQKPLLNIYQKELNTSFSEAPNSLSFVRLYSFINLIVFILLFFLRIILVGANALTNGTGGVGLITRLYMVIAPITFFSTIYLFFNGNKKDKIYFYIYFLFFCLQSFTGRSKSSIFSLLCQICVYAFFDYKNIRVKKFLRENGLKIVVFGFMFSLYMIFKLSGNGIGLLESLKGLGTRFVAFGDMYIYGYIQDYSNLYNKVSFFHYITYDLFRVLRIANDSYATAVDISNNLLTKIYGGSVSFAPNPRFNYISLYIFGYFETFVFSFFIGFVLLRVRIFMVRALGNKTFSKKVFTYLLSYTLINIVQDAFVLPQFLFSLLIYIFFKLFIDFLYIALKA